MAAPGKPPRNMQMRAQRHQVHDEKSGQIQERFHATIAHNDLAIPDAEELARMKLVDPDLIPWLMDRTGREQDFRHNSHNRKLTIREKNARSDRRLNGWGMLSAFIIFMTGEATGIYLISKGSDTKGFIFSGGAFIIAMGMFLSRNNSEKPKQAVTEASMSEPPA